ncbi:DNA phosphorothioation-associated putative methyltransferase [Brevundimonas denitrificans]|uniref:DNA phosphorothioation-associated putative methyltransferase n=1 Tax=Brevundimonas denitrificans TaxID=1443434 RepID=UPI0024E117BE|nr:DNA phosphorothioation-associated putative methyltransferase [Brevundimonas denitrificans]
MLTYEDFSSAFPILLESLTVDLGSGSVSARSYRERANPPILHRKELLVGRDHPDFELYLGLTRALETLGLLDDAAGIGTRGPWQTRLALAGVRVEDHDLVQLDAADGPTIHRHRAAIHRDGLSAPVQALLTHGLIKSGVTVFDYGCGRGSDIRGLRDLDVQASGWDPYFEPNAELKPADIVNLGFVLNVIERPQERLEALRHAFALAGRCLAIAVIQPNAARWLTGRPYGDGVLTRLGTFQRFFTAEEVKTLVEQVLEREAFAVSPGVFFVFKDAEAEQAFLLRRQDRRRPTVWSTALREDRLNARKEALGGELDRIVDLVLELGRWPFADEVDDDVRVRIKAAGVGYPTVLRLAQSQVDDTAMVLAAEARREDLSVYFALNLFNRRIAYRTLPIRLQRDVKALFGGHAAGLEAGRRLLFSLADIGCLKDAAKASVASGDAVMVDTALWVSAENVRRLPAILRCFIGCAERYFGGLEQAELFKVHLDTGKLTALAFSDFSTSPLPRLKTRVKIDLRRQRIDVFDHEEEDQRMVGKGRFLGRDHRTFANQLAFDAALASSGLVGSQFRARSGEIEAALSQAGLVQDGWRIIPAKDLQEIA